MHDFIEINGEQVSKAKAMRLLRLMCDNAKRIAGEFHNYNRSEKFRANWPDEYKFANSEWRNFIEAAHQNFVELIRRPDIPDNHKHEMFLAIVLWKQISQAKPGDNRIQLMPNTQQFEGDPYENRKIKETYGSHQNLRALLLNSAAARN